MVVEMHVVHVIIDLIFMIIVEVGIEGISLYLTV